MEGGFRDQSWIGAEGSYEHLGKLQVGRCNGKVWTGDAGVSCGHGCRGDL